MTRVRIDDVTEILREAAATEIMPRFRSLHAGDVSEKAPGELVTVADRESEKLISRRLRTMLDIPVVGEEAAADHPELLHALHEAPAAWLVDPVDGTANFVAGSVDFAVMVALVRDGVSVAAWILHPVADIAYVAELGSGAYREGERLARLEPDADPARWTGALFTRFMDPEQRTRAEAVATRFADDQCRLQMRGRRLRPVDRGRARLRPLSADDAVGSRPGIAAAHRGRRGGRPARRVRLPARRRPDRSAHRRRRGHVDHGPRRHRRVARHRTSGCTSMLVHPDGDRFSSCGTSGRLCRCSPRSPGGCRWRWRHPVSPCSGRTAGS